MQMIEVARYPIRIPAAAPIALRAGILAWSEGRTVHLHGPAGAQTVVAGVEPEHHELSVDGRHLLVRGDDGRRAQVWEIATGERVLEVAGDEHRQSLRAHVAAIGGVAHGFVISRKRRGVLRVVAIPGGEERTWQIAAGALGFLVDGVIPLEPGWLAVRGHGDGEGRDTVVAVRGEDLLADQYALQTALTEPPSVLATGFRLAIGPAGDGHVVTFHDHERDPDDPPDDPDDAFVGFTLWDLATRRRIDRVAYAGEVADAATIAADDTRIVVEGRGFLDVIARPGGERVRMEALALDPHALQVARQEGDAVVIAAL